MSLSDDFAIPWQRLVFQSQAHEETKSPQKKQSLSIEYHDSFLKGPPASGLLLNSPHFRWPVNGESPNPCTPPLRAGAAPRAETRQKRGAETATQSLPRQGNTIFRWGSWGFRALKNKKSPSSKRFGSGCPNPQPEGFGVETSLPPCQGSGC